MRLRLILAFLVLATPVSAQIKVVEQHRLGTSVNVAVVDADGKATYNRYVPASDWDTDPQAVAARLKEYLNSQTPGPAITISAKPKTVEMTEKQITDKLAALAAEKQAAEDAAKVEAEGAKP